MSSNSKAINAIVIMFGITAVGVILISLFVEDGATAIARIGLLVGLLAPTIASIAVLAKQQETTQSVQKIQDDVSGIRNGEMEKKIKSVLHDVLTERLNE